MWVRLDQPAVRAKKANSDSRAQPGHLEHLDSRGLQDHRARKVSSEQRVLLEAKERLAQLAFLEQRELLDQLVHRVKTANKGFRAARGRLGVSVLQVRLGNRVNRAHQEHRGM